MPYSLFNLLLKYPYLQKLLETKFQSNIQENELASQKKCQDLLTSVWHDIDQNNVEYLTSGGYAKYMNDTQKAEASYSNTADLGPMKEKVLADFLSVKQGQKDAIMAADKVGVLRSNSMLCQLISVALKTLKPPVNS